MNYVEKVKANLSVRLPDCPPELIDLYALLVLTLGLDTSLKDVHDAWAIWKNQTNPQHKSLIPFHELTPEVQELDLKYKVAIHNTWIDSRLSTC